MQILTPGHCVSADIRTVVCDKVWHTGLGSKCTSRDRSGLKRQNSFLESVSLHGRSVSRANIDKSIRQRQKVRNKNSVKHLERLSWGKCGNTSIIRWLSRASQLSAPPAPPSSSVVPPVCWFMIHQPSRPLTWPRLENGDVRSSPSLLREKILVFLPVRFFSAEIRLEKVLPLGSSVLSLSVASSKSSWPWNTFSSADCNWVYWPKNGLINLCWSPFSKPIWYKTHEINDAFVGSSYFQWN